MIKKYTCDIVKEVSFGVNKLKLYTIRHGETIVNVKDLINSRNMIGLNKKGKEQAKKASEKIAKLDIDLIICSPLRRTVQTCRLVNKNKVKVKYDRRLMERNAKSMQFKKCSKIDFDMWYDIEREVVYKDAEGFKALCERVGQVIQEIKVKYNGKNILFVTHGDVCKAVNAYVNNITDIKKIREYKIPNCHIAEYDI